MTKSLDQFKIDTLGGRFGVPGTNNSDLGDPAYAGQCVSYVRLYMEEVLGIKTAVWGHAVSYWSNPSVLRYFDKVSSPQDGDIVVWGDDPGNWTGPEGHIAIWYRGQILNQNYGGSLKVSLNNMFTPGLLGYLRPKNKGGSVGNINQEEAKALQNVMRVLNSEAKGWDRASVHAGKNDAKEVAYLASMNTSAVNAIARYAQQAWDEGGPYRANKDTWLAAFNEKPGLQKQIEDLQNEVETLTKQLNEARAAGPSSANASDAEKKLQAIKDALK